MCMRERERETHIIGREREEEKAIELHVYLHDVMTVHIITTCAPLCLHIACCILCDKCNTISFLEIELH